MTKKKENSKEAWLDWLRDEPQSVSAQQDLRDRFKRQANSYQPVNRAQPQYPSSAPISLPARAQESIEHRLHQTYTVAPQSQHQPQSESQGQATSASNSAPAVTNSHKTALPATVSIQIHLPSFQSARFQNFARWSNRIITAIRQGTILAKNWYQRQLVTHRVRTLGFSIGIPIGFLLLFVPPLLNFGNDKTKTTSGSTTGTTAGAAVKYDQPPFEVITPSGKTKLATPDGVHAAYDGTKNTYSFTDSIGDNGFTVSQQPLPPQFSEGKTAVETIAPTINKGVTPTTLKILTGNAAVSTNPKYNSQTVVVAVRNQLLFIQSSHQFKTTDWENYLNTLQ